MYATIQDIKQANRKAGYHFFETGTSRYFGSRTHSTVYGGRYFITSEARNLNDSKPAYTIRYAHNNGSIETIGEFCGYETLAQAQAAVRKILNDLSASLQASEAQA